MRKFGKESTAPKEGVNRESGGWLQNHCALAVCFVIILAFVMRVVFAYGFSADNGFALSGGSEAQYHLHVVESILDGSFIIGSDAAINYPVGGLNVNAPLYDFVAAGVGSFAGASTALAILAPIFGALTCFPVYLIGKELYGYKAGFVAALIYGLLALPIVSTVMSNGTEYAFVAFLVSFFILSLIKVSRKISEGAFAKKEAIIAGVLFALVVLSWNDFRGLVVLMAVLLVVQMVLDRFNSKDFSTTLYTYAVIMVIGLAVGAAYYIPAKLWDAVFSGPVLIAIIVLALGFIFKALQKQPWIFVIPGLFVAFIAIMVVFYFALPDYFSAMVFGNSVYTNDLMADLVDNSISISQMSSYYGWVLMWMPPMLGLWELYKYVKKDHTHAQLFMVMWLFVLWIFTWMSYSAAAVLGMTIAVSSGYVLVAVFEKADLKSYWSAMKAAGFPGCFKKMLRPVPFLAIICTLFLVAVPGIAFAVDAGIPSNADSDYKYYGNTVYTIQTGDDYPTTYTYDYLEDEDKAVVTWINYAAPYGAQGYNTVNDMYGEGASAAAQIYLAKGAAGATAAQIVRVMEAYDDKNFSSAFPDTETYDKVKAYIDDPCKAKSDVLGDTETYGQVASDIGKNNAMYLASINVLTEAYGTDEIMSIYDKVKEISGANIGYYVVDGSMLPIVYGDGSNLSTMAYFAGYNTDRYGAAPEFYSYITYYSNYYPAYATESLYETFLWKALIGPSPAESGESSSFSYLYDLTASNGDVKAMPGYGLAGYNLVTWFIKYNPNPKATGASDGWEYMHYLKAFEKQANEGGVINYLSSVIVYEYVGNDTSTSTSVGGKVVDENGDAIAGVTVDVYAYNATYGADTIFSQTKTNQNGEYSVLVPETYTIHFKNGSTKVASLPSDAGTGDITISSATFNGKIAVGENAITDDSLIVTSPNYMYVLTSKGIKYTYTVGEDTKTGTKYYIPTSDGRINSSDATNENGESVLILPGSYSYELRDSSSNAIASGDVTFYSGLNENLVVSPSSYTITATVNDFFGNKLGAGSVIARNVDTGAEFSADVSEGKAVIYVPSGTYSLRMGDGYYTSYSSTLSVTSNRTATITAYEAITVTATDEVPLTAYAGSFTASAYNGKFNFPVTFGSDKACYTVYGYDGQRVYIGVYKSGSSVTVSPAEAITVTGSMGESGTVSFINADGAVIKATADSDGKFTANLAAGTYTIYATDGSSDVYIGSQTIDASTADISITLVDGKRIIETYNYESGTSKSKVALPFAYVEAQFNVDSTAYALASMTDTSGKATFYIPETATDVKVEINGGSISNAAFEASDMFSEFAASDSSKTYTIVKDNVKDQTVTIPNDMKLKPYGGQEEEVSAGTKTLKPGQYTVTIDASTGSYFSGTVYLYPGQTEFTGLNTVPMYTTKITYADTDKLTVTGDKTYRTNSETTKPSEGIEYYFEDGCEYLLKSVSGDGKKIAYGEVASPAVTEVDMTATAEIMNIKGYVGVSGDGTVTASFNDFTLEGTVKSGAFEFQIPSSASSINFEAKVTNTVSSQKYEYAGEMYVNAPEDGMIVNIPVSSYEGDDSSIYTADLDGCIMNASFNDGDLVVTVKVFNNSKTEKAYVITSGAAWDANIKQIVVAAGSSTTEEITGTYEPNATGIGSNGMSVVINDFNGTGSKTIPIVDGDVSSSATVSWIEDPAVRDTISGNAYMYAIALKTDGGMGKVAIEVEDFDEPGYSVRLMNENGTVIGENGSEFVVSAQKTTVVYVVVMKDIGQMDTVPTVTVKVGSDTKTLEPESVKVHASSYSVSGDDIFKEKAGIPKGVWFLFGLSVILLILIVWMGSKRGVFSRR